MDIVYPVPKAYAGNITQGFGGPYPAHDGIDFGVGAGNSTVPCIAAASGTVTESLDANVSYGCRITIDHGRGVRTRYCHLKAGSRLVKVGDRVEVGQRIGTVGSTGNSPAGEHLHFMVYRGGSVVDPRAWLSGAGTSSGGDKAGTPVSTDEPSEPLPDVPSFKAGSARSRPSLGDSSFTIDGKAVSGELEDLTLSAELNLAVEQVGELRLTALDPSGVLLENNLKGSVLGWDGAKWDIGAATISAAASQVELAARSRLARRLRATYRVVGEHKVGPDEWVERMVRGAGGKAVCERTGRRAVMPEDKSQTAWDALAALAGDLGWSWTEYAGAVYFGSRMWAYRGGPGLPTWPVTWRKDEATDALDVNAVDTDDDPENRGVADLELPWHVGHRIRPWHLIELTGLGKWDGTWLVESVTVPNDGTSSVSVSVAKPKAKAAKEASSVHSSSAPKDKRSPAYAKWYAKRLAAKRYGWGEAEYAALEQLWTRESGWRWDADNPTSDAYGIPQALPGSKMGSAGADWRANPETQVKWGLGYIKGRYGSPSRAWAFWQRNNWY